MIGDWKIHGLDADIDIRCQVALPDGRRVPVPVTVNAEHGRFYFEPDQTVVLDLIHEKRPRPPLFGLQSFPAATSVVP